MVNSVQTVSVVANLEVVCQRLIFGRINPPHFGFYISLYNIITSVTVGRDNRKQNV